MSLRTVVLSLVMFSPILSMDFTIYPKKGSIVRCGHENYRLQDEIYGKATYGKVYRAVHEPFGREYAIKILEISDEVPMNYTNRELFFMEATKNMKNIVQMKCHMKTKISRTLFSIFVMEYMSGGSLNDYARKHFPLSEDKIRSFLFQMAEGLEQLYEKNIMHRDLKTQTFFLSSQDDGAILKIGDLKLAATLKYEAGFKGDDLNEGTLIFKSPERLRGGPYDYTSDVWSVGIILHHLITGELPFGLTRKTNDKKILKHIESSYSFKELEAMSNVGKATKKFIKDLLQPSGVKRMSMKAFFRRAKFLPTINSHVKCKENKFLLKKKLNTGPSGQTYEGLNESNGIRYQIRLKNYEKTEENVDEDNTFVFPVVCVDKRMYGSIMVSITVTAFAKLPI